MGNKFSKTWRFSDINYSVASASDQTSMFMDYCHVLNALPSDCSFKVSVYDRKQDPADFASHVLIPYVQDSLDGYRKEYNTVLQDGADSAGNIVQEKYITASVQKKTYEEARNYFARVGGELSANFGKLSSKVHGLSAEERLLLFHDFFRSGEEGNFHLDLPAAMRRGSSLKDGICPDGLCFKKDHLELGGRFGRVLFLKDFPSFLHDSMISELTEFHRSMMLSIDILPIPTDEAVKELQKKVLGIETDITRWQQKQNQNNNWATEPPYELSQMREEMKEFLDDLTKRDQRMMFGLVTLVHMADTLEELNEDTDTIISIGNKYMCQYGILRYQQEAGLNTVLPYGLRLLETARTLTTESLAVLMPFSVQEVRHKNGNYYGQNAVSRNLILCNRKDDLLNGNGFFLGVPGSGKSMMAKWEAVLNILKTGDDVIFVDPEREYGPIVQAVGGQIVRFSADSKSHINAMAMTREYSDGENPGPFGTYSGGTSSAFSACAENPVTLKSEFVLSLCEQLMGTGQLGAKEKSIVDRCVALVYRDYIKTYTGMPPTLVDLHKALLKQPEPEAREVALALELFTGGSLNVFAHQTNVDMENRVMCFDILDLGKQLKTVGMLVMLDAILNRVSQNREKGKRTHIYFDEMHLFFANEYSSNFLSESWKRFRKYGALASGITQNITDCLQSHTARTMLANSEFLVLLNQAPTDRAELAKLLHISETQMSYITNAEAGSGLIKVQGSLVPFVNKIPKNTQLYKLMSTKPGE